MKRRDQPASKGMMRGEKPIRASRGKKFFVGCSACEGREFFLVREKSLYSFFGAAPVYGVDSRTRA